MASTVRVALSHGLTGAPTLRRQVAQWDRSFRAPLGAVSRIGVVELFAGSGATTIAANLTAVFASRRSQPVLAVDMVGDPGGLAARWRVDVTAPSQTRRKAASSADAEAGLVRGPQGQRVLCPPPNAAGDRARWGTEVAPIARFYDVVVTDFGVRNPMTDLAPAAALCDVVCLVVAGDRVSAEIGASVAAAIAEIPEKPRVILTLVDLGRRIGQVPQVVAGHAAVEVAAIPYDLGLPRGHATRGVARAAILSLAARIIQPQGVVA